MHICHKKLGVFITKWTELFSYLFIYGQGFTVIQLFFCFSNLSKSRMPGEDNFDSERFVTIEYVHPGAIHHQLKKKSCAIKKLHETIGLFRPRKWRILPQWLRTKRGQFRNISIELILSSANGGHNTGQQSQFAEWYMQEHLHPKSPVSSWKIIWKSSRFLFYSWI